MNAQIIQRGKVLASFGAGTAKQITQSIRNKAEVHARILLNHNRMESGYYDLHLVDKMGRVVDSQILIA